VSTIYILTAARPTTRRIPRASIMSMGVNGGDPRTFKSKHCVSFLFFNTIFLEVEDNNYQNESNTHISSSHDENTNKTVTCDVNIPPTSSSSNMTNDSESVNSTSSNESGKTS
jgi:hypothetical protein